MAKGEKCSDLDLIETGLSLSIFQGLNVRFVEGEHLQVTLDSCEGPKLQIKRKKLSQTCIPMVCGSTS